MGEDFLEMLVAHDAPLHDIFLVIKLDAGVAHTPDCRSTSRLSESVALSDVTRLGHCLHAGQLLQTARDANSESHLQALLHLTRMEKTLLSLESSSVRAAVYALKHYPNTGVPSDVHARLVPWYIEQYNRYVKIRSEAFDWTRNHYAKALGALSRIHPVPSELYHLARLGYRDSNVPHWLSTMLSMSWNDVMLLNHAEFTVLEHYQVLTESRPVHRDDVSALSVLVDELDNATLSDLVTTARLLR